MVDFENTVDIACIGAALAVTLIYHAVLVYMSRYRPERVRHSLNQAARRAWTLDIMRTKRDIVGVQTLRNGMMAATLLATTSLTLSSIVAAYLYRVGDDTGLWTVSDDYVPPVFKLFVLLCFFMSSFFAFMQSLRSATTASFLISIRPELPECNPERTADIVQWSAMFYSFGSRAFVLSCVLLLWIFSAPAALVGSIIVNAVYAFNDFVH